MIIRCPSCSTTYKVDGSVFDAPQPTFRCSRCKHIFAVQVRLQLRDDEPSVPAATTDRTAETEAADDRSDAGTGADTGAETDVQSGADADDGDAGPHEPDLGDEEDTLELTHPEPSAEDAPPAPSADDDMDAAYDDFEETLLSEPDFELPELQEPETLEPAAAVDNNPPVRNVRRPDFEIDDDLLIPPRRPTPPPPPLRSGTRGSIVPLVSLVALSLFAFVLVALIYQINPQPLDSLLRRIPWYGSAVFEDRHVKGTLSFESLTSGVQPVLNQTEVFIVAGKLVNRNERSVHKIQIEALLFDAEGKQVGRQVTFVGNAISAKIIEDMTFREISMLQSLKPQSAYRIPANASANFAVVFAKPKAAVKSFSCRVLSAETFGEDSGVTLQSFLEPSPSPFSEAVTSISSGS